MIKTRDEFKLYLDNTKKETIILKFTATWCGPCKHIAPLITNLNNHYTQQNKDYEYIEIDIDESFDLYAFFKKKKMVNGVPALLSFRKNNNSTDNFWVPFQSTTGANVQGVTNFFKSSLE
jgi:thiol-disulfide isomerase/thioredoxin